MEVEVVGVGGDGWCGSVGGFLMCRIEAIVIILEGFHFLVEVVARLPLLGLSCRWSWTW